MLGELEEARQHFSKCLASGDGVCLDRRITIQAAEGLQKLEVCILLLLYSEGDRQFRFLYLLGGYPCLQKVVDSMDHATKLLEQQTSDAGNSALEVIAEALTVSPYSERLLGIKAKSMFMVWIILMHDYFKFYLNVIIIIIILFIMVHLLGKKI